MSAVPTTNARRIGDILLELGFVSEDALAKATVEQEKTGQPLGQILVDHGAITRLELASALAEQWSDQSASITLLPIPPPAAAPRRASEPHDDDQYAARLQDAVAELAQRVGAGAPQPTEELDDRVTDLAERIEATVARTQRIEATLATLAEGFEGVTGGVEEAFGALRGGMAGLALDLARIDMTVAELGAGQADTPATDPTLAARLEASTDEHESLATSVAQLGVRIDEMTWRDEGATTRLEELQRQVESVASTLVDVRQGLAAQEEIGAQGQLAELGQSLAAVHAEFATLARSVTPADEITQIAHRLDGLAAERDAQQALTARLEAIERTIMAGVVTPEDLTEALAGARDELTPEPAPLPDPRVDDLARELVSLRNNQVPDPRVEVLTEEVAKVRSLLAEVSVTPEPVTDPAVQEQLQALALRIDELAGDREQEGSLAAKLDDLERRLPTDVVTPEEFATEIAALRADANPHPTSDPRVEQLAEELAALRDQIARAERTPSTDPIVASELDTMSQRLRFMDARLSDEMATSSEVTRAVEALRTELAGAGGPAPMDTSELEGTLGALAARVDGLSDAVAAGVPGSAGPAADELQRLVDERVEAQVAERVAELTRGLEERLAAAEAVPRTGGVSAGGDTSGLEDLLERNRLTIERLGLHLGEHDRALAELMRSRNLPKKLDELAARVDEIAGEAAPTGGAQAPATRRAIGVSSSGPSTGEVKELMRRVEDAEVTSQADREKLMNRLERMASSIDWRLQRLEADEPAAGSSSED